MNIIYFIIQNSFLFIIPLLIVALGGMFSERGGVVNIALEGIMVMGAFFGIFFIRIFSGKMPDQLLFIVAILVSAIIGMIYSLFHAYAAINMRADQTISGTALNLFATAFAVYAAKVILGVKQIDFENTFRIIKVPFLSEIPFIGDMFFKNVYLSTYLGLVILLVSAFVLFKTRFGLRLRSCGEHPQASDAAGINVGKMRYMGVIISGALAGMGGLILIVPITTNFSGDALGYGFLALAVLIFGQWRPYRIFLAAVFFGLTSTISNTFTIIPFLAALKLPSAFYKILPYLATLIVLTFTSKKSAAPRASGEPYDQGKR